MDSIAVTSDGLKDAIRFQQFTQISQTDWKYDIVTRCDAKYSLNYRVVATGFVKETLMNEKKLIYDREFRIGERLPFTFEQVIQHFGNVAQVFQKS